MLGVTLQAWRFNPKITLNTLQALSGMTNSWLILIFMTFAWVYPRLHSLMAPESGDKI